jgi:hypothetical protein
MTETAEWTVSLKLKRGYEVPSWHRPEHVALESAQHEVAKLRQWDQDGRAVKSIVIREAK